MPAITLKGPQPQSTEQRLAVVEKRLDDLEAQVLEAIKLIDSTQEHLLAIIKTL